MLYRYRVKIDNSESPMYSTTKLLKDFGEDKEAAFKWAKENYKRYETGRKTVFVEESKYTCEENVERDFAWNRNYLGHGYWE